MVVDLPNTLELVEFISDNELLEDLEEDSELREHQLIMASRT